MIKNIFVWLGVTLCLVLLIVSCSLFKSEDPIERERKELKKTLNSFFVTYWRGLKITIRSLPIPPSTEAGELATLHEEHAEKLGLGTQLSRIFRYASLSVLSPNENNPQPELSAKDYADLAKEIYQLKKTIKDVDEDEFPTLMEVVSNTREAFQREPVALLDNWNSALEHWLFALVMETKVSRDALRTYELHKINHETLPTTDLKVLTLTHISIDHIRREWFHLANESLSKALVMLEDENITICDESIPLIIFISGVAFTPEMSSKEVFRFQMHGLLSLLRSFARYETDDKTMQDLAVADIEQALADFSKIGFENELTWLAATFLYLKKDNQEKALQNLDKLEQSELLTNKEKNIIADAKTYLNKRDPDAALNVISDKVVMYKLGMKYAYMYLRNIEWTKIIEQTEEGKRLLEMLSELQERYEHAKKYLDIDAISEHGKQIFENITTQ